MRGVRLHDSVEIADRKMPPRSVRCGIRYSTGRQAKCPRQGCGRIVKWQQKERHCRAYHSEDAEALVCRISEAGILTGRRTVARGRDISVVNGEGDGGKLLVLEGGVNARTGPQEQKDADYREEVIVEGEVEAWDDVESEDEIEEDDKNDGEVETDEDDEIEETTNLVAMEHEYNRTGDDGAALSAAGDKAAVAPQVENVSSSHGIKLVSGGVCFCPRCDKMTTRLSLSRHLISQCQGKLCQFDDSLLSAAYQLRYGRPSAARGKSITQDRLVERVGSGILLLRGGRAKCPAVGCHLKPWASRLASHCRNSHALPANLMESIDAVSLGAKERLRRRDGGEGAKAPDSTAEAQEHPDSLWRTEDEDVSDKYERKSDGNDGAELSNEKSDEESALREIPKRIVLFSNARAQCPECGVVVQRAYLPKHCKRYHDLNGETAREVDGIARRASRQYDQRLAQRRLASHHRQWDPPPHSRMVLDEGDVVESRNVDDPIVASAPSLTIALELSLDVIDASRCVCPSPGCDWTVGLIYLRDHLKRWCDHSHMLSAGYRADLEKLGVALERDFDAAVPNETISPRLQLLDGVAHLPSPSRGSSEIVMSGGGMCVCLCCGSEQTCKSLRRHLTTMCSRKAKVTSELMRKALALQKRSSRVLRFALPRGSAGSESENAVKPNGGDLSLLQMSFSSRTKAFLDMCRIKLLPTGTFNCPCPCCEACIKLSSLCIHVKRYCKGAAAASKEFSG